MSIGASDWCRQRFEVASCIEEESQPHGYRHSTELGFVVLGWSMLICRSRL